MQASKAFLDHLGAFKASATNELAASSSYDDYVAIARTFNVDQAFWLSLFADGAGRGTALVLETRLGALSARLSSYFKTVISWHASAVAAAATKRCVDDLNIKNVRIVIAEKPADLDLGQERFSAFVFYGLSEDILEQWGRNTASRLKSIMEKIPLWLSEDGIVVIGENNPVTYQRYSTGKRDHDHGGGIMLPGLRHQISRQLPYSELYVCSSPVTSGHIPPPDFVRYETVLDGTILPENWLNKTKNRILNSRPAKLLWPSFLMIGSNRPVHTLLLGILKQQEVTKPLGWGKHDKIAVKRIIAGNSGMSVVIAGPLNDEAKNVVVRLPSRPAAWQYCRINAGALKNLARTSLSDRVPRLICEGTWQEQDYTVESSCSGLEMNANMRNLGAMVRQGFEVLNILSRETGQLSAIMEGDFQETLVPLINEIAGFCAPDVRDRLGIFTKTLRFAMRDCSAYRGYTHGDFKLGNILFDHTRKLTAVIDWDGFSENGYQIFDYLTLLLYGLAYESDRSLPDVYLENLLPWNLPPSYARLADELMSSQTLDKDSFLLMRIVFWFSLLSARFDPLYKHHEAWQRQYLLPVLPVLEATLRAGGRHS